MALMVSLTACKGNRRFAKIQTLELLPRENSTYKMDGFARETMDVPSLCSDQDSKLWKAALR